MLRLQPKGIVASRQLASGFGGVNTWKPGGMIGAPCWVGCAGDPTKGLVGKVDWVLKGIWLQYVIGWPWR